MTELEIMRHAKDYLDKLARGIDPLTGREVPEGEIINNVRISRCLFYVSDVLRQVIENGGIQARAVKKSEKAPFALSFEERARYPFGDWPATASVIAQRLNGLVDLNAVQKLKITSITAFLMQSGLLYEEVSPGGQRNKRPTEAGQALGISTAQRMGQNGEYTAVVYSREAQQFVLDNLDAITALNAVPLHENEGKPWAPEEDAYLRDAYRAGTEVKEMSAALKRARASIRARLDKLGLREGSYQKNGYFNYAQSET
jgi:hypothetical protein